MKIKIKKALVIITLTNKRAIDEAIYGLQGSNELQLFTDTVLLYFFIGTVLLSIVSLHASINK